MSPRIVLHLPVTAGGGTGLGVAAAAEAAAIAAAAAGVSTLRLPDRADLLDPSLVAARLSPAAPGVGLLLEASTGDHAPYNLARRLASLARAHDGTVGVALRAGGLDPLTRRHSGASGGSPADVWREHVALLRSLWASFPADALLGDAEHARFADPGRIVPAAHRGANYRVAGALNVPTDPAHRPLVVADQPQFDAAGSADLHVADLHVADLHVADLHGADLHGGDDGVGSAGVATLGRVLVALGSDGDDALRRLRPVEPQPGRPVVAGSVDQVLRELLNRAEHHGLAGFDIATYPSVHALRAVTEELLPALSAVREHAGVTR